MYAVEPFVSIIRMLKNIHTFRHLKVTESNCLIHLFMDNFISFVYFFVTSHTHLCVSEYSCVFYNYWIKFQLCNTRARALGVSRNQQYNKKLLTTEIIASNWFIQSCSGSLTEQSYYMHSNLWTTTFPQKLAWCNFNYKAHSTRQYYRIMPQDGTLYWNVYNPAAIY